MRRHIHVHVYVGDSAAPTQTLAQKYADLLERMWRCAQAHRTHDEWAEAKHPRATDGRFGSKAWAYAWRMSSAPGTPEMRAVSFNETFAMSAGMESELKRNVESNWHPPGCDSLKSVMDHELGHQMDYMLSLRSNPGVNALYGRARAMEGGIRGTVSKYAATNISEFIAEAWAESCNNPEPREIAKRLGEIVRSAYEQRFGSKK